MKKEMHRVDRSFMVKPAHTIGIVTKEWSTNNKKKDIVQEKIHYTQEILDKIDSCEINKENIHTYFSQYLLIKYIYYTLIVIQFTFFVNVGYLIGYFLTH